MTNKRTKTRQPTHGCRSRDGLALSVMSDQRFLRTVVAKAFWPYWRRIGILVSRS